MKTRYLLLALLLIPFGKLPAQPARITGFITDITEQSKIPSVHVLIQGSSKGTISDADGYFEIEVDAFPVTLYFSHVGYQEKEIRLNRPMARLLVVRLEEKVTYLNETTVFATRITNLVKDKPLYIWDYSFTDSGILLLGSVRLSNWNKQIFFLPDSGDTVYSQPVPHPRILFRDAIGTNYLFDSQDAWQLEISPDSIGMYYPTPIDTFERIMSPVVGHIGDNWFVRQFRTSNQVLTYFRINARTHQTMEFRRIEDELGLEMHSDRARHESDPTFTEADLRFEEMCFFDEIFAPMVLLGDSVIILNFVDGQIEIYDTLGHEIAVREMGFETDRNWDERILVDERKGHIYTLWERHGMTELCEISLDDGSICRRIPIPDLPFVENISVRNDMVYFLYLSNTQQYKQLYRMEI